MPKKKKIVEPKVEKVEPKIEAAPEAVVEPVIVPEPPKPSYDDIQAVLSRIQLAIDKAAKDMVCVVNDPRKVSYEALEGIASDIVLAGIKIEALKA